MHNRSVFFIPLVSLFLASCVSTASATQGTQATLEPTETATNTEQPPKEPEATTLVPTSTVEPTVAPTNTPIPEAIQRIRAIMENYGKVDEKYLTDAYWAKMATDIETYGPARRILTLEFHGDNYYMYDGAYSMTPESFASQMNYLMANNFHFVTGPETIGFLEGWLELPARSVLLTTDSGAGTIRSMPRILALFQELEITYGYTPHLQSFIWTDGMTEEETISCKNDVCWEAFRAYRDSGYISFGSHTQSHADFSLFTYEQTRQDLATNMAKIKDNLCLNIYSITWPFEACSPYPELLSDMDIKFAFGGWTRSITQLYTYKEDNMPLCLPRLFPPNPHGTSGRPSGMTFPEMLDSAINLYVPIR